MKIRTVLITALGLLILGYGYVHGWHGLWPNLGLIAAAAAAFGTDVAVNRTQELAYSSTRRVLIIGDQVARRQMLDKFSSLAEGARIDIATPDERGALHMHNGGGAVAYRSLTDLLTENVVDEVICASPALNLEAVAAACVEVGVTFRGLVEIPRPNTPYGRTRVELLGNSDCVLSIETAPQAFLALRIKRFIDILGALVGLTICGVAYILYASRIKRETGASPFFRQTRVGQNGRRFMLYKFRTMYADAEERLAELAAHNEMNGHLFKMRDDPRITPLGRKLRRRYIDEFPQFINVLRGEMSLVGARPPTISEVARYAPRQRRRLSMKPGITGLWQIAGNGAVRSFDDVVRLDCEYIDNWSIGLDLKVIARTIQVMLHAKGW